MNAVCQSKSQWCVVPLMRQASSPLSHRSSIPHHGVEKAGLSLWLWACEITVWTSDLVPVSCIVVKSPRSDNLRLKLVWRWQPGSWRTSCTGIVLACLRALLAWLYCRNIVGSVRPSRQVRCQERPGIALDVCWQQRQPRVKCGIHMAARNIAFREQGYALSAV